MIFKTLTNTGPVLGTGNLGKLAKVPKFVAI